MLESPSIISVNNLTKKFGKTNILRDINLNIKQGEFVTILGASGSGKSTLLHLLGSIDQPSSGEIKILDQNITRLNDKALAKFRSETIGFVFQFFYLQPHLNILENLEIPCLPRRENKTARRARATKLAEIVGLGEKLSSYPKTLSGGELQRAAIARALMNNPKILLADEPTGNLDDANTDKIVQLLVNICRARRMTLIIVTHDERIAHLADRVLHLKNGQITGAEEIPTQIARLKKINIITTPGATHA